MDHPTTFSLLTWITFMPLIGAALILPVLGLRAAGALSKGAADQASRVITLVASGLTLVLALVLWKGYDPANPALQFVQHARWIPAYNIDYFVGVDGISITLVILSALISFIATIASMPWWPGNAHLDEHHFTQHGVPGYMALLLILQTGMIGVFVAMDMFLFYVFWEVMLLPMYFLIGIWGGSRKEYAAIKFFLYTLAGSVLMLLAIIGLYFNGPQEVVDGRLVHTFNMLKMAQWGRAGGYLAAPLVLGFTFVRLAWTALCMGFCLLGMSAFTQQGIDGAVLNLWTHGLISPMLFLIVGVIYDRAHHRNIEGFGGLAQQVPEYAGLLGLAFFASLGLPGLCGFVSEFTVFLGSLPVYMTLTIISATAVIVTAAYYLWAIQRMMLGPLNEKYRGLPDVNWRERLTLYPLAVLIIVFGFYPAAIINLIERSLGTLLQPLQ